MERGNRKQGILEASLELFSVQGFDATSISQIAGAVGVRKASLYSHFESKQEILEMLLKQILQQYGRRSIFAGADWRKDAANLPVTSDAAVQRIQSQIHYILHDSAIRSARKMLVIEQFRNPELAKLQTRQNYSDVMDSFTGLIRCLIQNGVLVEEDPEVMELVERHIRQFQDLSDGEPVSGDVNGTLF